MSSKRGPNGRALKKDGTERKARTVLTPFQKAAKRREQRRVEMRGIGRGILRGMDSLAAFLEGIGKVRGFNRTAAEYSTPEKRAAKRAYFEAQIEAIEGKGEVAEAYLEQSGDTLERIEGIEEKVGEDIFQWMEDNPGEPTTAELEDIVRAHITADDIEFVEGASDPENDPFVDYRRGADSDGEDSDTL
jgi:hypothetical protein